jgi:L-fucose isomerase-like protein
MAMRVGLRPKPSIGILFVTSGWFREVGLQNPSGDISDRIEETARRVLQRLRGFLQPVYPGVLHSVQQARRAAERIRKADVAGLLLVPLTWCEDQIIRAALQGLRDLPLILWTFSPAASLPGFLPFRSMLHGSGPVCTLQLSGMLRREGYRYRSVVGHVEDAELWAELERSIRAMAIARSLGGLRVGVLPFPCDQMSTTFADQFELRSRYGVELCYLELERFRKIAQQQRLDDIGQLRLEIEAAGHRTRVDERNLAEGLRYALAMQRIMEEEALQILAMNDVCHEMHASFGLRPCLWNPRLSASGVVVAMEADVAAGICMYVLRRFCGQPPFYTEPFGVDYERNAVLLGHAGYHDATSADPELPVEIVSDVEYKDSDPFSGAVTFFKYRSGPVTVVNSVWDGEKLKWIVVEGESLPGPPKMDGNCHVVCALKVPVGEVLRRSLDSGASQHWIVISGRYGEAFSGLCEQLDIRLLRIG